MLVFPEGGTTNGTALLKFKQGAFISEKRVKPILLKYQQDGSVHPAYDVIELPVLAILQMSWSCGSCKIVQMPEFEPT